eukprot:scaffold265343_cov17-Tisochrysis_lutea.AAC.2
MACTRCSQLDARLHRLVNSHQKASSFTETLRGGVLGVKSLSGRHALQYEMGWRRLEDVAGRVASRAVLAQAGDYLKAVARYVQKVQSYFQWKTASHQWIIVQQKLALNLANTAAPCIRP